ncbi:sugar phosphate isomerase/epimerase family protein [Streptomyces sp. NPDC059991]|uniref:sugar phosphate isomerase/epimerase family protein n=1 Tax=Streptomyces sp. NPDC059991 TaxID=3347028 RepID=UPI0036CC4271
MELCLKRATIAPSAPHHVVARAAAEHGFRQLEMSAPHWRTALDNDPGLHTLIAADALTPIHGSWGLRLGWDDARFEAELRAAAAQMAVMAALGSRSGSLVLPRYAPGRTRISKAQLQDRIGRTGALASRNGLDLVLEFIGVGTPADEGVRSLPEAVLFTQGLGYNVGIVLDTYHWHASNGTLNQLELIPPYMPLIVQIADAPDLPRTLLTNAMRTLPGDGVIDWPSILTVLHDRGYRGPLSIDVKPHLYGLSIADAVHAAHKAGHTILTQHPLTPEAVR